MRWLLAAFLLTAAPAQAAPSYIVGTWFGHGQPEDKSSIYIDRMRADGTWQGEYRACSKGKSSGDQIQTGRWKLDGDILTLGVETVGGQFWPRTDTYKMLAHSATAQKYLSIGRNFVYTPQRVADDFKMPSCELTS
ncbi:MAG: hypothetical protein H0U98_05135 [Alphaproteobacteria bacterium]|nr:hypothetical protein [Alphaproteobacteria bacterium]